MRRARFHAGTNPHPLSEEPSPIFDSIRSWRSYSAGGGAAWMERRLLVSRDGASAKEALPSQSATAHRLADLPDSAQWRYEGRYIGRTLDVRRAVPESRSSADRGRQRSNQPRGMSVAPRQARGHAGLGPSQAVPLSGPPAFSSAQIDQATSSMVASRAGPVANRKGSRTSTPRRKSTTSK